MASTSLDYLVPLLRSELGDTDATSYRYVDEWLVSSLVASVDSLERWWSSKYQTQDDDTIVRDEDYLYFTSEEPPVIQNGDEIIIVLMAKIIIKSGALENMSWDLGRWQDAEYSVSNIAGGDAKKFGIQNDLNRLMWYLKPPTKRTFLAVRNTFPEDS